VSDLHVLAAQLLSALATPMQNGSVTLSFHEGRLASVKTETHRKVDVPQLKTRVDAGLPCLDVDGSRRRAVAAIAAFDARLLTPR
jgi:hypothetical protein